MPTHNKLSIKDKILLNTLEDTFFLNLAIRLRLPFNTTKIQILKIHESILNGSSTLSDFSELLQKSHKYYLNFLDMRNNTILEINKIEVDLS